MATMSRKGMGADTFGMPRIPPSTAERRYRLREHVTGACANLQQRNCILALKHRHAAWHT